MKQKRKIISREFWFSVFLYLGILILDQVSKFIVRSNMPVGSSFNLGNLLAITYVTNTGVSFGMFKGYNWVFTLIALIALIFFVYFFFKQPDFRMAIALAGISGNLMDRIFLGYVVDFINFHFWPIFNIADSAIFIGLFLLILKKDKKIRKH